MLYKCIICNKDADRHHWRSRGASGTDDEWNLMPLDRLHHVEVHQIGNNKFAEKYQQVRSWLISNGWEFCNVRKKWSRYEGS